MYARTAILVPFDERRRPTRYLSCAPQELANVAALEKLEQITDTGSDEAESPESKLTISRAFAWLPFPTELVLFATNAFMKMPVRIALLLFVLQGPLSLVAETQESPLQEARAKTTAHYAALQAWVQRLTLKRPAPGAKPEEIEAFNREYSQYVASLEEYKKEKAALNSTLAPHPAAGKRPDVDPKQAELHDFRTDPLHTTFVAPPYGKAGVLGVNVLRVKGKVLGARDLPGPLAKAEPTLSKGFMLAPGWENEPIEASADRRDVRNGGTHVIMNQALLIIGSSIFSDGDTFEDIVYPATRIPMTDNLGNRHFLFCYATSAHFAGKLKEHEAAESHPQGQHARVEGTAFFITGQGHLVTNWHVVREGTRYEIHTQGKTYDAKLLITDKANDIAVLKIEASTAPLPIGPSKDVSLGAEVFTIGFPIFEIQGSKPKLTSGQISSLAGIRDDPRQFQVSVPVQPGNSGGGLVDANGNVVGIVSAGLEVSSVYRRTGAIPQNVNYAIKSSLLLTLLESAPEIAKLLPAAHSSQDGNPVKMAGVYTTAEAAAAMVLVY